MKPAPARYTVRRLTASDAEAFRLLRLSALAESVASFGITYEEEKVKTLQQAIDEISENYVFAVASDVNEIVGLACCYASSLRKLAHKAHIYGIYLKPEWRNQGIMKNLLKQLIQAASEKHSIFLTSVTTANLPALKCFTGLGFKKYATEEKALLADGNYTDLMYLRLDNTGKATHS